MERLLSLELIRYCANHFSEDHLKTVAYHTVIMELVKCLAKIRLPGTGMQREAFLWQTMTAVDSWSPGHGKLAKEGGLLLDTTNDCFFRNEKMQRSPVGPFPVEMGPLDGKFERYSQKILERLVQSFGSKKAQRLRQRTSLGMTILPMGTCFCIRTGNNSLWYRLMVSCLHSRNTMALKSSTSHILLVRHPSSIGSL